MRSATTILIIFIVVFIGCVSTAHAGNHGKGYAEALKVKAAAQRAAERGAAQAREKRRDAAAVAKYSRLYGSGVGRWAGIVNDYFRGKHVGEALRVIRGESSGRPRAVNGCHRGLFQISGKWHQRKFRQVTGKRYFWGVFNPRANIKFAAYLSHSGADWSAWDVQP